jgi:PIN domain nuclease of toxin-antitoxin system
MNYVLDTHALIWYMEGNDRLGSRAKDIISHPTSKLVLPAIALAEALWIIAKGKTSIPSPMVFLQALQDDCRITVHPLDLHILEITVRLTAINEMHDRQIVGTALALQEQGETGIITCDLNITDSQLVKTFWEDNSLLTLR